MRIGKKYISKDKAVFTVVEVCENHVTLAYQLYSSRVGKDYIYTHRFTSTKIDLLRHCTELNEVTYGILFEGE